MSFHCVISWIPNTHSDKRMGTFCRMKGIKYFKSGDICFSSDRNDMCLEYTKATDLGKPQVFIHHTVLLNKLLNPVYNYLIIPQHSLGIHSLNLHLQSRLKWGSCHLYSCCPYGTAHTWGHHENTPAPLASYGLAGVQPALWAAVSLSQFLVLYTQQIGKEWGRGV